MVTYILGKGGANLISCQGEGWVGDGVGVGVVDQGGGWSGGWESWTRVGDGVGVGVVDQGRLDVFSSQQPS